MTEKILHCFPHGLGDAAQFTAVLRHLKEMRPEYTNDVHCSFGKHSSFGGLARQVYLAEPDHKNYDRVIRHDWPECHETWIDSPATKTVNCLRHMFGLTPRWDLLNYTIQVGDDARKRAATYLGGVPKSKGYVFLHYQGNTSRRQKDLHLKTIRFACDYLIDSGYTPILLDWDRRSPLHDNRTVFCPDVDNPIWQNYGTGDAETIAALLEHASLFIGIDSGPQKIAFASACPTLAVWIGHHPIHYCDNAPNAIHLVPEGHEQHIRGNRDSGLTFFEKNYKHVVYKHLDATVVNQIAKVLGTNPMEHSSGLKSLAFNEDYYEEHRLAGLDYLNYGDWQRNYGKWFVSTLGLAGRTILDVGCACGSIATGLAEAGGLVSGCDLSEHMIALGRAKWPSFPLFVCDSVNLHLWRDNTFDCLHSAQVWEHYKSDLVPHILKELLRVTKPGGYLFAAFDTEELFARQGRTDSSEEDATHVCIKPLAWWHDALVQAGWELAPDLLIALKDHPSSYFSLYDWPAVCCRKPKETKCP